jgi:hypothetical protein
MDHFSDYLPGCEIMNDVYLTAAVLSGVFAGRFFFGYARKDSVRWAHCRKED